MPYNWNDSTNTNEWTDGSGVGGGDAWKAQTTVGNPVYANTGTNQPGGDPSSTNPAGGGQVSGGIPTSRGGNYGATSTLATDNSNPYFSNPSSAWGNVGGTPNFNSSITPPASTNTPWMNSLPMGGGASTPATNSQPPSTTTNFNPSYLTGQNVTGPGANGSGQTTSSQQINPQYYASQQTAQQLAKMLGGTAFMNTNGYSPDGTAGAGSPFSFANAWMVRLPDGRVVNAGQESQPWSNGSANSDTIGNILRGGATLAQQQALMPLSPSVNPQNYQGGSGMPLTLTPSAQQQIYNQAGQSGPSSTATQGQSTNIQDLLQQLLGQQQQQQQPFNFGSLIQQLYGSNPFTSAFGNYGNQAAQSAGNSGTSMSDIASILNSLFASRQQPSNSALSPLFWGNGAGYGTPQSSYYPTFR